MPFQLRYYLVNSLLYIEIDCFYVKIKFMCTDYNTDHQRNF